MPRPFDQADEWQGVIRGTRCRRGSWASRCTMAHGGARSAARTRWTKTGYTDIQASGYGAVWRLATARSYRNGGRAIRNFGGEKSLGGGSCYFASRPRFTDTIHGVEGASGRIPKMETPTLAEKLDKIRSPGLQSQQRVSWRRVEGPEGGDGKIRLTWFRLPLFSRLSSRRSESKTQNRRRRGTSPLSWPFCSKRAKMTRSMSIWPRQPCICSTSSFPLRRSRCFAQNLHKSCRCWLLFFSCRMPNRY